MTRRMSRERGKSWWEVLSASYSPCLHCLWSKKALRLLSTKKRSHLLLTAITCCWYETWGDLPSSILSVFIDFPHNTFLSRELRAPSIALPVFWDTGSLGMWNWVSSRRGCTAGIADYLQSAQGKEVEWLGKGCKEGRKLLLLQWFMDYGFLIVCHICLQVFLRQKNSYLTGLLRGAKKNDTSISLPLTRSSILSPSFSYLPCEKLN